jgi:hypothetical protein
MVVLAPDRRPEVAAVTDPADYGGGRRGRRWVPRSPVIIVLVAALVAAVALDRTEPDRDANAAAITDAPAIPGADALSVSWYCPEGSATDDGRADETVLVANLGDEDATAVVSVFDGNDEPSREPVDVPARSQVDVELNEVTDQEEELLLDGTIAGPGVMVEAFGGEVVVEHAITRGSDFAVGPCARGAAPEWFFAAGTTVRGTELMLSLFNPFGDDAIVDLTFLTDTGVQTPEGAEALIIPRRSRVSVPLHALVQRQAQVATVVRTRTGRVIAEQSLASDGSEIAQGFALSLGATDPAQSWTLPHGSMPSGSTHNVSVANFTDNGSEAQVRVDVDDGGRVEPQTVPVAARSVTVVDVGGLVPVDATYTVGVRVTGEEPVVVEELVTSTAATAGGLALGAGVREPARRWAFAGAAGLDGDAVVSVVNRGSRPVTVSLTAYASDDAEAPESPSELELDVGERGSFELGELDIGADLVLVVEADGPVFASRLLSAATGRSLDPGIPGR